MSVNLPISCPSCGGTQFEMPLNPKPSDTVACHTCRQKMKYSDLLKHAEKYAAEVARKALTGLFKK